LGGIVLLGWNVWVGHGLRAAPETLTTHFLLGLVGPFLSVFAQAMTLFYLLGSARSVAVAVEEGGLDEAYRRRARRNLVPVGRVLVVSVPAVLASPVLGGAAMNAHLPAWPHLVAAYAAVAGALAAYAASVRALAENYRFIAEADAALAAAEEAPAG
jgi:hypothetical protein